MNTLTTILKNICVNVVCGILQDSLADSLVRPRPDGEPRLMWFLLYKIV